MTALSLLLAAGCAGVSGGPREQADGAISDANKAVSEHDRLFAQARDTYNGARRAIDDGKDPKEQAKRFAQAREKLTEARTNLEKARDPLQRVHNLDVAPEIKEYASSASQAMDAQLEAEAGEIKFYGILQKDPILKEDRKEALDVLSKARDSYGRAEASYARSKKLADAHPKLIRG